MLPIETLAASGGKQVRPDSLKASVPMDVTEAPMVTEVRSEQ